MSILKLRHFELLVGAAALALSGGLAPSAALAAHRGGSASNDQHFMTEAIQGDLSEVQMGKLAQDKGQNDRVKQFGKMLQEDHSEHLQKAQQIASQDNLKAPSEPNATQQRTYQRLSELPSGKFDAAFAKDMVQDHKNDISKYRKEARSGSDLADFAKQTIPVLQKHLESAEALRSGRSSK
jgi:putative membrane protein